ncbi:hypothetical protein FG379_000172 [Cryptosporidium bovis]|uniref:uncharacterized protein n=1 Tax=Cryptosporidium bovis TaxID=310047 RepID=UPI00351A213D|nr:hypothetical protein FG379_000172 [Cryptosporidium bovis]
MEKSDHQDDGLLVPLCVLRKLTNNNRVTSLEFINNDKLLVSGTCAGNIDFWDLKKSRYVLSKKIEGNHYNQINKTIYSDNSRSLYVQSREGELYIMESIEEKEKLNVIKTIEKGKLGYSMAKLAYFSSESCINNNHINTGNGKSPLFPLVPTEDSIVLLDPRNNHNHAITFKLPEKKLDKLMEIETLSEYSLIGGFESGKIAIWDTRKYYNDESNNSGLVINKYLNDDDKSPIMSIKRAFNRIWISSFNSKLQVYNRNNFDIPIKTVTPLKGVVDKISVRSDYLVTILSYATNGVLELFENKSLEPVKAFNTNLKDINTIEFSNFSSSSLFACSTNTISIFDVCPDNYYNYEETTNLTRQ